MRKIFFGSSLVAAFLLSAVCLAQGGKTVLEELAVVREIYGVRFVYDADLIRLLDKEYVGANVKGLELERALDAILKGTGVSWNRQNDYIVLTSASKASGNRLTVKRLYS